MSAVATLGRDAGVLFGRQVRHTVRYPELTVLTVGVPVVLLLLFVLVFGGALGPGVGGSRGDYAGYVLPGVLALTAFGTAQGTSTTIAMDASGGVLARLRTVSVSRSAVLAGHALAATAQTVVAMALVVLAAVALGFRPGAAPLGWLGAAALATGSSLAVSWLAVAAGLLARSVEVASNYALPLMLLPFLGSGFVPVDSLPGPLAAFARHQPVTPVMDVLRALLAGTPADRGQVLVAVAWCAGLTVLGVWGAARLFGRPRSAR
ncbi:ABC transporter permease [Kineococcus rhizosphaerae]|uniref:Transport permease protein n=1 Tax=Kineococcus rhizosphaerae TaxID=559628 RepID=A0A2T0R5R9_9ACTN|nr:ABC transporter permease [Kineococcus rhizosphaerae]PRY16094.1 ABC-2 type transport system permease protein [Kineococcus rhizosphaerae]